MKKKLFKIIPFVSIAVVVLAFGFLFIPKSFVTFESNFALFGASGFEIFFYLHEYLKLQEIQTSVMPAGIVTVSLMILAIAANVFANKQSVLKLLGGILTASVGLMLLSMQLWMWIQYGGHNPIVLWAPYVTGAFTLVAGGLTIWAAIEWLIEEKNTPVTGNKSYSYLKK